MTHTGARSDMLWVFSTVAAAAIALAVGWRVFEWVPSDRAIAGECALAFLLVCVGVGAVWACERRIWSEAPEAKSAVLFGFVANILAVAPKLGFLRLRHGAAFDPFQGWGFDIALILLAGCAGVALAARAMIRSRCLWKLLGLLGLVLSLTPPILAHLVYLWILGAKGLRDLL